MFDEVLFGCLVTFGYVAWLVLCERMTIAEGCR